MKFASALLLLWRVFDNYSWTGYSYGFDAGKCRWIQRCSPEMLSKIVIKGGSTDLQKVISLKISDRLSSVKPNFSNIFMLFPLSIPILAIKDFRCRFSTAYFSMISVASQPNPFPRAPGSAIIISTSPMQSPASSLHRNRFVSPTIAAISFPSVALRMDLSRIIKVSSREEIEDQLIFELRVNKLWMLH